MLSEVRKVFWVHLRLSHEDILNLLEGHSIECPITDVDMNKNFNIMANLMTSWDSAPEMKKLREKLKDGSANP